MGSARGHTSYNVGRKREMAIGTIQRKLFIGIFVTTLFIVGSFILLRLQSSPSLPEYKIEPSSVLKESTQTLPVSMVELNDGDTYDLTASVVEKQINGKKYSMLAYNNSIPGPLIKVTQGSEITVNFKNETDMKTLLHSHGVRMENKFDGSQATQKEMEPGETFAYHLRFPDVGMYWYHPHVREDYQQELGLYGGFLVTPKDLDYWNPVSREIPLFLDDILIENGQIRISQQNTDHTLMGRYGNIMLVNGQTDYNLSVKNGETIRFYLINTANARPFKIAIPGLKLKLVGADGGAYEKDGWQDSVVLGPSERAIVEILFAQSGTFNIENSTPDKTYTLGTINVLTDPIDVSNAQEFSVLKTHAQTIQSIDPLRSYFDKALDKKVSLTLSMGGNMMNMDGMGHSNHMMGNGQMMVGSTMDSSPDGIEWDDTNQMMNEMSNTNSVRWKMVDQDTGKENMDIDWVLKKDQPIKIRIFNDPDSMHPMQHPIHFHGQQFLVLARNGVKNTNLVWKDTVLIPSGQALDILLYPTNPGSWMAHCHIAEHLEAGMMMTFEVVEEEN